MNIVEKKYTGTIGGTVAARHLDSIINELQDDTIRSQCAKYLNLVHKHLKSLTPISDLETYLYVLNLFRTDLLERVKAKKFPTNVETHLLNAMTAMFREYAKKQKEYLKEKIKKVKYSDGTLSEPAEGEQPTDITSLAEPAPEARCTKGVFYPDMPPVLPGESSDEYTDRLTGADGTNRVPYDHRRYRQCSIGYHDECTDTQGETCKCPCHSEARCTFRYLLSPAGLCNLTKTQHTLWGHPFQPQEEPNNG